MLLIFVVIQRRSKYSTFPKRQHLHFQINLWRRDKSIIKKEVYSVLHCLHINKKHGSKSDFYFNVIDLTHPFSYLEVKSSYLLISIDPYKHKGGEVILSIEHKKKIQHLDNTNIGHAPEDYSALRHCLSSRVLLSLHNFSTKRFH